MTGLLEFREKIKLFYSRNEFFIFPVIKFLLGFVTLNIVNSQMGYMTKLDNMALVLIVALACSFLPTGSIVLFAAAFSILHMYALSMEVALVGLVVYILIFLLYLRFGPKDSLLVVLTPVFCIINIPYVIPIAMGLVGSPVSAISICCGVIVYYLFQTVTANVTTIQTMGEDEITAKVRLIIDGILDNKSMLVMMAAFAITVIVVYLIRRMSIDHSWTIAIVAGVMVDLVILLVGDLIYDTNVSVISAVLGAFLAAAAGKIIEFFRFCVDYSRTEKVQFEDDEYYYYVKAIPKMTVTAPTNTVKKINAQKKSSSSTGRATQGATGVSRTVITERTNTTRSSVAHGQSNASRRREHTGGNRSVTINSNRMTEDSTDDLEDLF